VRAIPQTQTTDGRRELIDAILSDIGVPEELSSAEQPFAVRERADARPPDSQPVCHIVAGANGSGKSTFALHYLPRYATCLAFVNPDLIALGLSPFDPTQAALAAGRLVLERIASLSAERKDFGFETTLSGRGYLAVLNGLKVAGYRLHLYYLWTPECDLLVARIRQRVSAGGHNVPERDVRRRYARSLSHLREHVALMDKVRLFDTSGSAPVLVFEKNGVVRIHDEARFEAVNGEVGR